MDTLTKGLLYLRQAHKALTRDFPVAYDDRDWNIAVRRAQECAEFAVKGAILILGDTPPPEHTLKLPQSLVKTPPLVAFQLEDDPTSGTVLLWSNERETTFALLRVQNGVFTQMGASHRLDATIPFVLETEGSTIRVLQGDRVLLVNSLSSVVEGQWKQAPISRDHRKLIDSYVSKLYKQRNAAFYFDLLCNQAEADRARSQAWEVLRIVLGSMGLQVAKED